MYVNNMAVCGSECVCDGSCSGSVLQCVRGSECASAAVCVRGSGCGIVRMCVCRRMYAAVVVYVWLYICARQ